MDQILLIESQQMYADEIWKFRQEILECDAENEDQFAGCMSLDVSKSSEEWIKICELRKSEETCGDTGATVPSHTYLAIRKRDDKVVGVIDLRHHIAKSMGIQKLLVTCNSENAASEKVIIANGGVFEKIIDVDGCKMKRYWIVV